jgi:hypothetical protein
VLRSVAEAMAAKATILDWKSQHYMVNDWITKQGLAPKFDILPRNSEFTFRPIGDHSIKWEVTSAVKLFCGGTTEYQTWAFMITGVRGALKLEFVNEHRTGEVENVHKIYDMALMYPFQVFKKYNNDYGKRQLEHLILYLFLINGHASRVFGHNLDPAKWLLSAGIGRVVKAYEEKGIDNITKIYQPGEDMSAIRSKTRQPNAANDLSANNDGSASNSATVVPMGSPPIPPALRDINHPEPQFETISVSDLTDSSPRSRGKRGREDEDDFDKYKRLMRERKDLVRKQRTYKEKSLKLKKNLLFIEAKDQEKKKELEALLADKSRDEIAAWLMRGETLEMEEEGEEADDDMEVEE